MMASFQDFLSPFWYTLRDLYSGSHTRRVLEEAVVLLSDLWPYLVAGILLTTLIKLYLSKDKIAAFFNRRNRVSILLAAFIGVVAPLGSYVVIPLSASLFILGTPLPVLMALLVASPLIDPNLFILTAGAFGYELALARLISAFLLGLAAGYLTQWLLSLSFIRSDRILTKEAGTTASTPAMNDEATLITKFFKSLWGMTLYICKYFFLAILLAALIKILTPPNLMIRLFNGNNFLSVLFSTAAGIPFYTCGGAAIPVVRELADLGLSKGASLAFFIAGPVTKFSNLVLMYAAYKFRVFMIYILSGILGALLFGLVYNIL
ncbi:MAG: permease [Bacteroidales bacterium]|nr:permease [Bacteroidales bacterium]